MDSVEDKEMIECCETVESTESESDEEFVMQPPLSIYDSVAPTRVFNRVIEATTDIGKTMRSKHCNPHDFAKDYDLLKRTG